MVQNQQQLKALLTDTITMLCKNSVTFHHEICIEALIGITLDQKDIVLVNINEILPLKGHLETELSPKVSSSLKSLKRKRKKKSFHTHRSKGEHSAESNDSDIEISGVDTLKDKSRKVVLEENNSDKGHDSDIERCADEPSMMEKPGNVVLEEIKTYEMNIKTEPAEESETDPLIIKEEPESPGTFRIKTGGLIQSDSNIMATDNDSGDFSYTPSTASFGCGFQSDSSQSQRSHWMNTSDVATNQGFRKPSSSNTKQYKHLSHLIFTPQSACSEDQQGQRYICGLCLKEFSHHSGLYRHKLSLHGIPRYYQCTECLKPFNRKDNLIKHLKTVHKLDREKVKTRVTEGQRN